MPGFFTHVPSPLSSKQVAKSDFQHDLTLHFSSLAHIALLFTKGRPETIKYTTKNICQGFFREGNPNAVWMDQASVRRTETTLETPGVSIVMP
jgi:hypothetical protein